MVLRDTCAAGLEPCLPGVCEDVRSRAGEAVFGDWCGALGVARRGRHGADSLAGHALQGKGTLYFHNNTVVSTRAGNTTLLRLSSNDQSADVRNNVLYVSASGNRLAMLDGNGRLTLANDWLKSSWVGSHGTLSIAIQQPEPQISATSPGFVNEAAQDYGLLATSSCVNGGGSLLPDAAHQARMSSVKAPIYLLHGETDDVIPAAEALWAELELSRADHAVLVSPVLRRVDRADAPKLGDQMKLVHFVSRLL